MQGQIHAESWGFVDGESLRDSVIGDCCHAIAVVTAIAVAPTAWVEFNPAIEAIRDILFSLEQMNGQNPVPEP